MLPIAQNQFSLNAFPPFSWLVSLPKEKRALPISKDFTRFYAHFIGESESRMEIEIRGAGPRSIRKLKAETDDLINWIAKSDVSRINDSPKIRRFIRKQLSHYSRAIRKFVAAVSSNDGKRACLASRQVRKAIELLAAIHPLLVIDTLREAEEALRSGWEVLREQSGISEIYLNNIEARFLFLQVTIEAVDSLVEAGEFRATAFQETLLAKTRERTARERNEVMQMRAQSNYLDELIEIRKAELSAENAQECKKA